VCPPSSVVPRYIVARYSLSRAVRSAVRQLRRLNFKATESASSEWGAQSEVACLDARRRPAAGDLRRGDARKIGNPARGRAGRELWPPDSAPTATKTLHTNRVGLVRPLVTRRWRLAVLVSPEQAPGCLGKPTWLLSLAISRCDPP